MQPFINIAKVLYFIVCYTTFNNCPVVVFTIHSICCFECLEGVKKMSCLPVQVKGLNKSFNPHSSGLYITCSCDSLWQKFYLPKFKGSKKTLPKCVLVNGNWYSPTEVERLAGRKARKWRQSLLHLGNPLSDYNLSCPHVIQGSDQHATSHDGAFDLRSVSNSVSTVNNSILFFIVACFS